MLRFLKQIEKFASILMLGIMCFCITLQVFFRYVLSNALEWPEEVSRYAFLCAVFLGASFAAAEGRHLEISVLKNLFGRTVKLAVTLISAAATVVFCGIMCVWGVRLVEFIRESGQTASSIPLDMYLLYIVVPVSMALMAINTVRHTLDSVRKIRRETASAEDIYKEMSSSW